MSQQALVDTGVLYAAFDRNDQYHDTGLAIVRSADCGSLPQMVVVDFVLAETMNALTQQLAHDDSVDVLSMLERSVGFDIQRTGDRVWDRGLAAYESHAQLSLVDALLVAFSRETDCRYLYSFDDGFDSVDGLQRLNTNVDPYDPAT